MARSPLYGGIKGLLTCDSGDVVSGIVGFVVSQNRLVGLLSAVMEQASRTCLSWLATAVIVLNGLRCHVGVRLCGGGDTVIVARRPNERREIEHFRRLAGAQPFAELAIVWSPLPSLRALIMQARAGRRDWRRAARLARVLCRRHGVFQALRVVELIAYYRRFLNELSRRPWRAAVMSSHSNPHGIALHIAARRLGIPIVLMTHGMPVRPLARLDYDLAVHECEASWRIYEQAGCAMTHVVIKSRRQDYAPLSLPCAGATLTVGVFLSKDAVESTVMQCLHALLTDRAVARIIVRPHPVNLWRHLERCLASLGDARVGLHSGTALADDLRHCDVAIAGNSTVLLDAVVAGRPGCYVRGFDHGPFDVQDFVKDGLIYEWSLPSPLDLAAIDAFYRRPIWPEILRRYADIDRSEDDVATAVRAALDAVTGRTIGAVA
jgi:hypothetical protein